jgi:hypothetical protein
MLRRHARVQREKMEVRHDQSGIPVNFIWPTSRHGATREGWVCRPLVPHEHPSMPVFRRKLVVGKRKPRTQRATSIFDHVVHTWNQILHFAFCSFEQLLFALLRRSRPERRLVLT